MSNQTLAGFHAIGSRLKQKPETIICVYYDAHRKDKRIQRLLDQLSSRGLKHKPASKIELNEMAAGVRHQGVVAVVKKIQIATDVFSLLDELKNRAVSPLLLVLDGVTDPHNLGACLRTADAAGVHAVIAPKDNAVGLTSVVRRVASGAAEVVPYFQVTNLARTMRSLQQRGIWFYGTDDQGEQNLYDLNLGGQGVAWVMGAEGHGLRRLIKDTCDVLVRIPMRGSVESLNVSVATAVCLYESVRQLEKNK